MTHPVVKTKKRNSVCLDKDNNCKLYQDQTERELPKLESFYGSFQKTRRYSDSKNPHTFRGSSEKKREEQHPRTGRRSSMTATKSLWSNLDSDVGKLDTSVFQPIGYSQSTAFNFDIPVIEDENSKGTALPSKPLGYLDKYYLDDIKLVGLMQDVPSIVEKKTCRKGPWTKEEDDLLIKYASEDENKNKNWTAIAEKMRVRTPKQCRERWCFNLDPSINKEDWTVEEDMIVIKRQSVVGNKWAQIAQLLPGRTENAVKTRFKSIARAKKREWKPEEDLLLLKLFQKFGVNWEAIAYQMESHRTKHAVKMRIKALQQGLINLKDPENGSARLTVRLNFYPKETLKEVSEYYQRLASGEVQVEHQPVKVEKTLGRVPSFRDLYVGCLPLEDQVYEDGFLSLLGDDLVLV